MQQSLFAESMLVRPKKTRPIIKWTGGKYDEYPMFANYIPGYKNYFEPFFGGGGVFFAEQPKGQSFLNDKSKDLIQFYSLLGSQELKRQLFEYADAWDELGKIAAASYNDLLPVFTSHLQQKQTNQQVNDSVSQIVNEILGRGKWLFNNPAFIIFPEKFRLKLAHSITDKMKRIAAICSKEARMFDERELKDHIETSIRSGLYLFMRTIGNSASAGNLQLTPEKASANWYFVREFCYASMFRFNAKGDFNIPYGGIAYNRKDFRQKVKNIFSEEVTTIFKNATLYNLDFADFLEKTKPAAGDFIFVDPPYDSEFSEYDQNAFTKDDQVRLRDVLIRTKAKMMMVIKETEFIRNLYSGHCRLIDFEKTYTYNVRGRNNRDTRHLIILNYDT